MNESGGGLPGDNTGIQESVDGKVSGSGTTNTRMSTTTNETIGGG